MDTTNILPTLNTPGHESLIEKTRTLRKSWKNQYRIPWQSLIRYEVWPGHRSISFWEHLWWTGFHALRLTGLFFSKRLFLASWHPGLKHGCANPTGTVIILDDLDDYSDFHQVCTSLKGHLANSPSLAPVLITSHADFAFYSRLGWLVEYLPRTLPNHEVYIARKKRYLAWRYKYALVLPLSAGRASEEEFKALMQQDRS